jgi:hypothetical protein
MRRGEVGIADEHRTRFPATQTHEGAVIRAQHRETRCEGMAEIMKPERDPVLPLWWLAQTLAADTAHHAERCDRWVVSHTAPFIGMRRLSPAFVSCTVRVRAGLTAACSMIRDPIPHRSPPSSYSASRFVTCTAVVARRHTYTPFDYGTGRSNSHFPTIRPSTVPFACLSGIIRGGAASMASSGGEDIWQATKTDY